MWSLTTSRTHVRVIQDSYVARHGNPSPGVQSPSGDHRCRCRGSFSQPRSPAPTGSPDPGSTSSSPATAPRATAAFEPRSTTTRRPTATATAPTTVELIVDLRRPLTAPRPRCRRRHHRLAPRTPPPASRCRGRRSTAPAPRTDSSRRSRRSDPLLLHPLPSRATQRDLAGRLHPLPPRHGTDIEILSWLDDHSRYALSVTAHRRVTGPDRRRHLPQPPSTSHGIPSSTLTDNGMVFTTRFAGGTTAAATASRPNSSDSASPEELATQPPHHLRQGRTLPTDHEDLAPRPTRPARHHRRAPDPARHASSTSTTTTAPTAHCPTAPPPPSPTPPDPKPPPATTDTDTHYRVRHDRVDNAGNVTLRHDGRLHHIGIGRTHAGTPVILLIDDLDIRIIHAATGEILRAPHPRPQPPLPTHRRNRGGPRHPYGPRKTNRPEP